MTTFTIGYEGKEDYNEFQFARRISQRYKTDHHETLINRDEMQKFLPLLVRLQDEPIADNVCIPLYFLAKLVKDSGTTVVQVGEGADENFLGYWWCEHYRQLYESVYRPARQRQPWWQRARCRRSRQPRAALSGEELEVQQRAAARRGAVLGRRRLLVGRAPAAADARSARRSRRRSTARSPGLLPDSHRALDSHAVVSAVRRRRSTGRLVEPEVLQKIPYLEMKLRLLRASADARRQADDGACDRGAGAVSRSRRRRVRDAAAAVLQAARTRSARRC